MTLDEYQARIGLLRADYYAKLTAAENAILPYGLPLFCTPGAGESNLLHYAVRNIARSQRDERELEMVVAALEADFDRAAAALRKELDS